MMNTQEETPLQPASINKLKWDFKRTENNFRDAAQGLCKSLARAGGQEAEEGLQREDIFTAEFLGNQTDYMEQAIIAFMRAFHAFTAVLRQEHPVTAALGYPERKKGPTWVPVHNPRD